MSFKVLNFPFLSTFIKNIYVSCYYVVQGTGSNDDHIVNTVFTEKTFDVVKARYIDQMQNYNNESAVTEKYVER